MMKAKRQGVDQYFFKLFEKAEKKSPDRQK